MFIFAWEMADFDDTLHHKKLCSLQFFSWSCSSCCLNIPSCSNLSDSSSNKEAVMHLWTRSNFFHFTVKPCSNVPVRCCLYHSIQDLAKYICHIQRVQCFQHVLTDHYIKLYWQPVLKQMCCISTIQLHLHENLVLTRKRYRKKNRSKTWFLFWAPWEFTYFSLQNTYATFGHFDLEMDRHVFSCFFWHQLKTGHFSGVRACYQVVKFRFWKSNPRLLD